MKKITLLLLVAGLLPACVLAWNTPGEDFSGELKVEGVVTSTRNPWVWKLGEGYKNLDARPTPAFRGGETVIPVPLPALNVVLGKTILTTPAGREGLSPRVNYGRGAEGFSLVWAEPGMAEVTLPVTGGESPRAGRFLFRMQVAGVLRHVQHGQEAYASVYDDLKTNGLPGEALVMNTGQTAGALQMMFAGEGPAWLQTMAVSGTAGLSRFSDAALRQVEGVYGAQIVAGSGELHLSGDIPERWQVSLPVSIEYQ